MITPRGTEKCLLYFHSLDDGHDAVDGGDVVDAPGDESGLVKICPGFPDCDAHLDTPQQED